MTRNEARRTRCRHCPPSIGKVKPRTRTTKAQARVPCVPQLRAKGSLDSGSLRAGAAVRKAAAFLRLPSELTGKGTKEEHKRENKGKCRSFRSRFFFFCFSPCFEILERTRIGRGRCVCSYCLSRSLHELGPRFRLFRPS